MTPRSEVPRVAPFLETASRMVVARGGGKSQESLFDGHRVSVWEDEDLETDGGDSSTSV